MYYFANIFCEFVNYLNTMRALHYVNGEMQHLHLAQCPAFEHLAFMYKSVDH